MDFFGKSRDAKEAFLEIHSAVQGRSKGSNRIFCLKMVSEPKRHLCWLAQECIGVVSSCFPDLWIAERWLPITRGAIVFQSSIGVITSSRYCSCIVVHSETWRLVQGALKSFVKNGKWNWHPQCMSIRIKFFRDKNRHSFTFSFRWICQLFIAKSAPLWQVKFIHMFLSNKMKVRTIHGQLMIWCKRPLILNLERKSMSIL